MSWMTHFRLSSIIFYLNIGVWKLSSTTPKLKTVVNGSFNVNFGFSLNDRLHVGPNLLPHLCDIIGNWRCNRFFFTADDAKMYRQILIHPGDCEFQSILRRFCFWELIIIWLLITLTYRFICLTYFALRSFKELAREKACLLPLGVEILDKYIYMDEVTSGGHTVEEVKCEHSKSMNCLHLPVFHCANVFQIVQKS